MKHLKVFEDIIHSRTLSGNDDAFYICDIGDVKNKYETWINCLPRVIPYFAVKSNDNYYVIRCLANLGSGFDCASEKEIKRILSLGVSPDRIVYSHTAKQISHLKFAAEKNVRKMTFDSEQELYKIKKFYPEAEVILRIRYDSTTSIINLGLKFGCDRMFEAPKLIELCKKLDLNLIGVSFHVGSGTEDGEIFGKAIAAVHNVFNVAKDIGFKMNFVDIGGGFMGYDKNILRKYAEPINKAIEKYFNDPNIVIISEPGRYFVESAFTRAVQVILKKHTCDGLMHYYVNDGIYMSFLMDFVYNGEYLKHGNFHIIRHKMKETNEPRKLRSVVWGVTCSSMDKVVSEQMIPELEMGDWLLFENMGAYTTSVATKFNGFEIEEEDIIIVE
jgi:ornithine decarboxylase